MTTHHKYITLFKLKYDHDIQIYSLYLLYIVAYKDNTLNNASIWATDSTSISLSTGAALMKFYTILAVMVFTLASNIAYASDELSTDETDTEEEVYEFCTEKALKEGIIDKREKTQFIDECIDNYKESFSDSEKHLEKIN